MFATCSIPRDRSTARLPDRVGMEPDREVGAGAAVAERVEAALVQRGRALPRAGRGARATPRQGRARRAGRPSRSPPRAARRRARRRRGVAQPSLGNATIDQLHVPPVSLRPASDELAHPGARDAGAVEVGEELGLGVAGDRRGARRRPRRGRRVASRATAATTRASRRRRARMCDAPDALVGVVDIDVRAHRPRTPPRRPHGRAARARRRRSPRGAARAGG